MTATKRFSFDVMVLFNDFRVLLRSPFSLQLEMSIQCKLNFNTTRLNTGEIGPIESIFLNMQIAFTATECPISCIIWSLLRLSFTAERQSLIIFLTCFHFCINNNTDEFRNDSDYLWKIQATREYNCFMEFVNALLLFRALKLSPDHNGV